MKANKANGIISTKDYPKALTSLKKDFPTGIEACGADALRFGLCCNDVSSKLKIWFFMRRWKCLFAGA